MKSSIQWIICIILFSSVTYAKDTEDILAHYQKRGLTFVAIKGVPDQEIGGLLVKEIYSRLKIPVTIVPQPGKRALRQAMDGKVDGESMRIMKIQEIAPTLIRVSPHISIVEGSVFTKKLNFKVDGWSSLSAYNVGVVRGVQYVTDGTNGVEHVQTVDDGDALMIILNKDRVDLVVTARYNGLYQLKKLNLHKVIRHLSPPVVTLRLYHYLHVKHRLLVPIVEDLVREMFTSGELQKLRMQLQQKVLADLTHTSHLLNQ